MKILIVTRHLPWPLDSGGNTAQFALLEYLRKKHEFTMIVEIFQPESYAAVAELQSKLPEVKIIPVGKQTLTTNTNDRNLVKQSLQSSKELAKSLLNFLKVPAYPFKNLPLEMVKIVSNQVQKESYDLIQVEFTETMSIVNVLPKTVKKVFVNHQIHYKYVERQLETLRGYPTSYKFLLNYFLKIVKTQELAFIEQYDAVITFSEGDQKLLLKELPQLHTYVSPFPIILPQINQQALGKFQNKLVYLGGEKHYPNKDAVEWFLTEIWSEIYREQPHISVYIIGKWSPQTIAKYASLKNVIFTGFIPSLLEVFTGAIMIVPLRIGSGIRTKILDAMANGLPVVSTTIGCEGLSVTDQENIMIADQKSSFINAIFNLVENFELRERVSKNGLEFVTSTYSQCVAGETRNDLYKSIVKSET